MSFGISCRARRLWIVAIVPALFGCGASGNAAHYRALRSSLASSLHASAPEPTAEPFPGEKVLSRDALITQVLLRNPTVSAAKHAWRAAIARYPQSRAFADPVLAYEMAPGTMVSSEQPYGQVIRLSQHFEWPGKRALRGAVALAEADAKGEDLAQVMLHLQTTASILFDDYFVVTRALEINKSHVAHITRLRQSAETQYLVGRSSQQDPLHAELELALVERERLGLVARKAVVIAQLNGILHRPVDASLPPPPSSLKSVDLPELSQDEWLSRADKEHPSLRVAERMIEAKKSGVSLAKRASYPDFSIAATYNSMWPQTTHQFMLGFSLNIPIQVGARRAGVDQASATLAEAQSIHAARRSGVAVSVRESLVQLEEAVSREALYREQILPTAKRHLEAAEAGYVNGKNGFSDIMGAQHRLRMFEFEHIEARADISRRRIALTQAVGIFEHANDTKVGGR